MDRELAEEYTITVGTIAGATWRQIMLGKAMGVPDALGISTRRCRRLPR